MEDSLFGRLDGELKEIELRKKKLQEKKSFWRDSMDYFKKNIKEIQWKTVVSMVVVIEIFLPIAFRFVFGDWTGFYVGSCFTCMILLVVVWLIIFGKN
jgi:fatty-acid desaturase